MLFCFCSLLSFDIRIYAQESLFVYGVPACLSFPFLARHRCIKEPDSPRTTETRDRRISQGSQGHGQLPVQPRAYGGVLALALGLGRDDAVADEEVDEDGADVGLELAREHGGRDVGAAQEDELVDLVVAGGGADAGGQLHVVAVEDLGVEVAGARAGVGEGEDAGGAAALGDEGGGKGGLLGGLGGYALRRGLGGLGAAGDGAVELARVRVEVPAAAGAPDEEVAGGAVGGGPDVGRHVGAAGGDAEEGGGEALELWGWWRW